MGNDPTSTGRSAPAAGERLHLHPSASGTVLAWSAGPVLLGLGLLAALFGDGSGGPVLFAVLGLAATTWVAWDVPLRVEVGPEGVTRVCALRRQLLPWDQLVAIERVGRAKLPRRRDLGLMGRLGSVTDEHEQRSAAGRRAAAARKGAKGGLLARGPRRASWQLIDRAEGHEQFLELRRLVGTYAEATQLRAGAPPVERGPTRPLIGRGGTG